MMGRQDRDQRQLFYEFFGSSHLTLLSVYRRSPRSREEPQERKTARAGTCGVVGELRDKCHSQHLGLKDRSPPLGSRPFADQFGMGGSGCGCQPSPSFL